MPVEISLLGITDIMETPFVSSNIPVKIPFEQLSGIPKKLVIGEIKPEAKFNILLAFKIDIITENRTIKPPIKKIVLTALIIDEAKISPKFVAEINGM